MQELNLYSKIEKFLDFADEIKALHQTFKEIIEELNPTSLIDIGCGQGDFLLSLDNKIDTLGIDLSDEAIALAKAKQLNAQNIDLCKVDKKFQCATAIFDVINYIPQDKIGEFFKCCYDVLEKDGYFIFDINTLYGFEDVAQGSLNIDLDDKYISIDAYFEDNILETKIVFFEQKDTLYKKQSGIIRQYYHTKKFLQHQLEILGFEIESAIKFKLHSEDDYDKQIFITKRL